MSREFHTTTNNLDDPRFRISTLPHLGHSYNIEYEPSVEFPINQNPYCYDQARNLTSQGCFSDPSTMEYLNARSEHRGIPASEQTFLDSGPSERHTLNGGYEDWRNDQYLCNKENVKNTSKRGRKPRRRNSDEERIINLSQQLTDITAEKNMLRRMNSNLEREAEFLLRQIELFQRNFGTLSEPHTRVSEN
ncbi:hypothetical protein SK128_019975 [Halocaridina rubra]|uniref:Uncharacterized protein n=1 Tax=Halocaridina rubra TaxID=373956 RepID=A0AAN9ADN7_HALRR